jgi:predicted nucleic acid-binding protein
MTPRTSADAMAFEHSVAVFDACILYPFHLRNVVVQAAADRLVEARWTDAIHEEWIRNLAADVPAIPVERLQVTRRLMNDAVPTAMVTGYEEHIPKLILPDPDDRHVLAAAIAAKASLILTWNLRHFPASELKKFGLRTQNPDAFLSGLFEKAPDLVIGSLANARRNLSKSRIAASDFIAILNRQSRSTCEAGREARFRPVSTLPPPARPHRTTVSHEHEAKQVPRRFRTRNKPQQDTDAMGSKRKHRRRPHSAAFISPASINPPDCRRHSAA